MGVNKPEDKKLSEDYDTYMGHANKLAENFPSAKNYLMGHYPAYYKSVNNLENTVRGVNAKTSSPTLFSAPNKPVNPNPNSDSQKNDSDDQIESRSTPRL